MNPNWSNHCLLIMMERNIYLSICAAAKSLQLCPTLCDPKDSSPPGSAVPGILQARTLEWVAISFSNAWKWKVKVKLLSRSRLLATPWTAAYQAPLSMDFPGKRTGVGCHCLLRKTCLTCLITDIQNSRCIRFNGMELVFWDLSFRKQWIKQTLINEQFGS